MQTKTLIILIFAICLFVSVSPVRGQNNRWMDWSKKDAEKVLSNSPWAQTQTDTDTSEMFFSPTSNPTAPGARRPANDTERLGQGATNQSIDVKFHVRFFSARPIRRALTRLIELQNRPDADTAAKLHAFAELKSTDSIILTLSFDTSDQRYGGQVMQAMNSAVTATLKNESYLEYNSKRLFLEEYIPPGKDGFGARFIFLRNVDGHPFISSKDGEVRFVTKYPSGLKVNRVFKLSDMVLYGSLEY